MSRRENVDCGVHVAVMMGSAIGACPFSDTQPCSTFRTMGVDDGYSSNQCCSMQCNDFRTRWNVAKRFFTPCGLSGQRSRHDGENAVIALPTKVAIPTFLAKEDGRTRRWRRLQNLESRVRFPRSVPTRGAKHCLLLEARGIPRQ